MRNRLRKFRSPIGSRRRGSVGGLLTLPFLLEFGAPLCEFASNHILQGCIVAHVRVGRRPCAHLFQRNHIPSFAPNHSAPALEDDVTLLGSQSWLRFSSKRRPAMKVESSAVLPQRLTLTSCPAPWNLLPCPGQRALFQRLPARKAPAMATGTSASAKTTLARFSSILARFSAARAMAMARRFSASA